MTATLALVEGCKPPLLRGGPHGGGSGASRAESEVHPRGGARCDMCGGLHCGGCGTHYFVGFSLGRGMTPASK
jgi:hypothetical protein